MKRIFEDVAQTSVGRTERSTVPAGWGLQYAESMGALFRQVGDVRCRVDIIGNTTTATGFLDGRDEVVLVHWNRRPVL